MCFQLFKIHHLLLLFFLFWNSSLFGAQDSNKNAIKVYHIQLNEEIQPAAGRLIKKSFQKAEREHAAIILLEINTYGGRLDVADSIRSKILYSPVPTVAFINNNAASAGALISLACDSIYMKPGASIGAATVVDGSGNPLPDKYQSYMRGMMRSTAETKGRNPDIAEAMVDERKVVPGISDSGKVLTLTAREALKYHIANGIANNVKDVLSQMHIQNYQLIYHTETTSDQIVNFLLNPLVNSILILLIIGGIYFELKTPGLGIPSLVAIIAAILYFAPLLIDGTANVWKISLFLIGIVLLLLEIFAIPGFGITGISGILFIIAGLTLSLVHMDGLDFKLNPIESDLLIRAFFRVTAIITLAFVVIFFFGGSLLEFPVLNKLVLKTNQEAHEGYSIKRNELYALIGKEATVINQLRPAGKVIIDGEMYEAVSLTQMVEKGEKVQVVGVDGYSLKVNILS